MQYSNVPSLGEALSRLGFGAMRLPLTDPSDPATIDMPLAQEMIDYAYSHGVNYYDTAYVYHAQTSEIALGRILGSYPRDSFHIATKMPVWLTEKEEDLPRLFQDHLTRLNTDYIDFYLLHALDKGRFEKVKSLKMYDFVHKLKKEGRIRFIGFSFHDDADTLAQIVDTYDWDFVQIQLNYFDWDLIGAGKMYKLLEERGIPTMVMEPLRGGYLSQLPDQVAEPLTRCSPGMSQASFGFRWLSPLRNASVILSGMSTLDQVKDNIATFDAFAPLSKEELAATKETVSRIMETAPVPCTSCAYCMPCPFGVNIPENFARYNKYKLIGKRLELDRDYNTLARSDADAGHCVACGACTEVCPQKIAIPDLMREIVNIIKA